MCKKPVIFTHLFLYWADIVITIKLFLKSHYYAFVGFVYYLQRTHNNISHFMHYANCVHRLVHDPMFFATMKWVFECLQRF